MFPQASTVTNADAGFLTAGETRFRAVRSWVPVIHSALSAMSDCRSSINMQLPTNGAAADDIQRSVISVKCW